MATLDVDLNVAFHIVIRKKKEREPREFSKPDLSKSFLLK